MFTFSSNVYAFKNFHFRHVMVILESLATGHKVVKIKPKGEDKLEMILTDPYGECSELRVTRLLSSKCRIYL